MHPSAMRWTAMLCAVLGILTGGAPAATIHVDDDAPGDPAPGDPLVSDPLEDGSAAHPFDAIQEAIDASVDGDVILVANGTYTGRGNRALSFGGRAIELCGAGDAVVIDLEGAAHGFDFVSGETAMSVLRGLTIRNGRREISGAAVRCENGSTPLIVACTFENHRVDGASGGAVACLDGATMRFDRCVFEGNHAFLADDQSIGGGGAIVAAVAALECVGCRFESNAAFSGTSKGTVVGGAIWTRGRSALFAACEFVSNQATTPGLAPASDAACGGAVRFDGTTCRIVGSEYFNNATLSAYGRGGAVDVVGDGAELLVEDTTFTFNLAYFDVDGTAGAISAPTAAATMRRCRFTGNGAIPRPASGEIVEGRYGAIDTVGALFEACQFIENNALSESTTARFSMGGVGRLSGTFRRCFFEGNTAERGGALAGAGPALIENCVFVENEARHSTSNGTPGQGGAIYVPVGDGSDIVIVQSTFRRNEAIAIPPGTGASGGAIMPTHETVLTNCIVYDNHPDQFSLMPTISYSNVQGGAVGAGNIDADPRIILDYVLRPDSPCIDAGSALERHGTLDHDGQPRRVDDPATPNTGAGDAPHPDMGAYEYQPFDATCAADLDASGVVDFHDLLLVLDDWGACDGCPTDLNGDGIVGIGDVVTVLFGWGVCP